MRLFVRPVAALLAAGTLAAPARADTILGMPRIDGGAHVILPGGPTLGTFQGGTFTLTPDAIRIRGTGSTGTISGMGAAAAPGGTVRSFADWFADRTNVLAFAGADLSAKFAAACAALPATGGAIYIPAGNHTASDRMACDGKNVAVIGDGPGVTTITFTSAVAGKAGLSVQPGDITRRVTIRDLSIITAVDQPNGNRGLTIKYPTSGGTIFKGARIANVDISGTGNNEQYWKGGIYLENAASFRIDDVSIRGKNIADATAFPDDNMVAAVDLYAPSGPQCSDGVVTGLEVAFAKYVGRATGDCEGLHWDHVTGLAVDLGFYYPNGQGWPAVYISNSHINSFSGGALFHGWSQVSAYGNLFGKWARSSQPWTGFALRTFTPPGGTAFYALGAHIHDNQLFGAYGGSNGGESVGLDASGSDGGLFSHNSFSLFDWVFDFGGIGSTNVAADNTAYAVASGWQKRVGLSTISRNNTPVKLGVEQWFVPLVGGGSANVGAWFQRTFLTADSTAVTYTDFTNAEAGRQITIIGQNANSTIAHNARIRLKGGTSFTTSQGSALTLMYTGEYWQEIGRAQ